MEESRQEMPGRNHDFPTPASSQDAALSQGKAVGLCPCPSSELPQVLPKSQMGFWALQVLPTESQKSECPGGQREGLRALGVDGETLPVPLESGTGAGAAAGLSKP